MVTLTDKNKEKTSVVNEEFEKYLIEQRTSTTFNGIEVAEFSWYKRILGLKA
jgi:hypothetical protein